MPVACLVAHAPSFTTRYFDQPGTPTRQRQRALHSTRPRPCIRAERFLEPTQHIGNQAATTTPRRPSPPRRNRFPCRHRLFTSRQRATPERQKHGMKHKRPCLPLRWRNACSVFNSGRIVGIGPRKSTAQFETFRQCAKKGRTSPNGPAPALMHSSRHRSKPFSILSRLTILNGIHTTTLAAPFKCHPRTPIDRHSIANYQTIISYGRKLREETSASAIFTMLDATFVLLPRIGSCQPPSASST